MLDYKQPLCGVGAVWGGCGVGVVVRGGGVVRFGVAHLPVAGVAPTTIAPDGMFEYDCRVFKGA